MKVVIIRLMLQLILIIKVTIIDFQEKLLVMDHNIFLNKLKFQQNNIKNI